MADLPEMPTAASTATAPSPVAGATPPMAALPDMTDPALLQQSKNAQQGFDQRDFDALTHLGINPDSATKIARKIYPVNRAVESLQGSKQAFTDALSRSMIPNAAAAALSATGRKVSSLVDSGPSPDWSNLYAQAKGEINQQEQQHPIATTAGQVAGDIGSMGAFGGAMAAEPFPMLKNSRNIITGPGIDAAVDALKTPADLSHAIPGLEDVFAKNAPRMSEAVFQFLKGPATKAAKIALWTALAAAAGSYGSARYIAHRMAYHTLVD